MSNETVTLKIFKYDPATDHAPHYKDYEITWQEGILLLPAVKYVCYNMGRNIMHRVTD